MISYGRLRSYFAFAFPLILALLYLLFGFYIHQSHQSRQSEILRNHWLNQAIFMVSHVRSQYSATLQVEKIFRDAVEKIHSTAGSPADLIKKTFPATINQAMPADLRQNCRIWSFLYQNRRAELDNTPGFMSSKKRAMELAFESLLSLSEPHADEGSRRRSEKFVAGVFGENSAPDYLAAQRRGKLTPVQFEGRPHYVYWQILERDNQCYGGFIALLGGEKIEDDPGSLQRLADQIFLESSGNPAIGFFCASQVDRDFRPICPSAWHSETAEGRQILPVLYQTWKGKNVARVRKIFETDNRWFYFDSIGYDTPYSVFIAGRIDSGARKKLPTPLPAIAVLFFLWSCIFVFKLRHSGFSLGIAFRMLFFMTGMLPVLIFFFLGSSLIEQAAESEIQTRLNHGYEKLGVINEKSEDIITLSGLAIKEALLQLQIRKGLNSTDRGEVENKFRDVLAILQARKFNLSYLLRIKPGREAEFFVSNPAFSPYARYHLEYFAGSCRALHKQLTRYNPEQEQILLTLSQQTLINSFGTHDENSTKDVFMSSHERITSFQTGNVAKHLLLSCILAENDKIGCYLIFGLNITETLLTIIEYELSLLNTSGADEFCCISRDLSTGLKVFPQAGRFINSGVGRQFRTFLEAASSSLFRMEMRKGSNIFIYEPLSKARLYYGGAVISIAAIMREKELKLLMLLLVVAALSGVIYLLAATVSSLMIQPTRELTHVFKDIAAGNFGVEFAYPFNNELGQLATATTRMIKGLKERQLLGKFVSTTFDTGVIASSRQNSAQEIQGAVLFSDIRNFTTISESHPPEEIGLMLNTHLRNMVEIIHHNAGQVEQFIGDAVVAFFPGHGAVSCANALRAAALMMVRHQEIQSQRENSGKVCYKIGIGLDYGMVMAGILSSGSRSEFAVIGPARENAEKCEAASKNSHHTGVITSRIFAQELHSAPNYLTRHDDERMELVDLDVKL